MSHLIEFEEAKSNDQTLKINGIYIHSKYNPKKEAEQYVKKLTSKNVFYVILGNGLGYYTEELLKSPLKSQFIVLEPIKELAFGENVYNFENDAEVDRIIKREIPPNTEVSIITIPNYEKFFTEIQRKIHVIIKEKMLIDQVFNNTIFDQTKLWQENFIKNLAYVNEDYNMDILKKMFDMPVIIASGGPSLDKQIPVMKKFRKKYILIAAGSTITSLMKHDLEPDFVIVLDGKLNHYKLFEKLQLNKASLVYSMVSHYKIRENHSRKCFAYFSSECLGLEEVYRKFTGNDSVFLLGGGSVSSYAISFAKYISTGPIALVGQDLAYTKGHSHAQSSDKFHKVSDSFKDSRGVFETVGYNGEIVETNHQFLAMKHAIEVVIESLSEPKEIYNCTEAGLNITGIPNMELIQFSEKFQNENLIYEGLNHLILETKSTNNLIQLLSEEEAILEEALALLKYSKSYLYLAKTKLYFPQNILNKLDENDLKLKKLLKKSVISVSAQKIMLVTQKASAKYRTENNLSQFEITYNTNLDLINELVNLIDESVEIISQTINNVIERVDKNE